MHRCSQHWRRGGAPKNPCVVASTLGLGGGASKNTSNMCLVILVLYLHFVHMYMSHAVYTSFKLILARVVRQNVWLIDVLGLISVKMICSVSMVCSSVGQEIDYNHKSSRSQWQSLYKRVSLQVLPSKAEKSKDTTSIGYACHIQIQRRWRG